MTLEKAQQILSTQRGSLTRLHERNGGGWRVSKYILRDASEPDAYRNRVWYEAAIERELDSAFDIARKYFGNGKLRPVLGGDRTPEYPAFTVHQ